MSPNSVAEGEGEEGNVTHLRRDSRGRKNKVKILQGICHLLGNAGECHLLHVVDTITMGIRQEAMMLSATQGNL